MPGSEKFFEPNVARKKQNDMRGDPEKLGFPVANQDEGPSPLEKLKYVELIDRWLARNNQKNVGKGYPFEDAVWPIVGFEFVQDDEESNPNKDYEEPVYGSVKDFLADIPEDMLGDPLFWQCLLEALPELPLEVQNSHGHHSELNELYWKVPEQIRKNKEFLDKLIDFFNKRVRDWDEDSVYAFLLKHPEKRDDYRYDLFLKMRN